MWTKRDFVCPRISKKQRLNIFELYCPFISWIYICIYEREKLSGLFLRRRWHLFAITARRKGRTISTYIQFKWSILYGWWLIKLKGHYSTQCDSFNLLLPRRRSTKEKVVVKWRREWCVVNFLSCVVRSYFSPSSSYILHILQTLWVILSPKYWGGS